MIPDDAATRAELAQPAGWAPTIAQVRALLFRARSLQLSSGSGQDLAWWVRIIRDSDARSLADCMAERRPPFPPLIDDYRVSRWMTSRYVGIELRRAQNVARRFARDRAAS